MGIGDAQWGQVDQEVKTRFRPSISCSFLDPFSDFCGRSTVDSFPHRSTYGTYGTGINIQVFFISIHVSRTTPNHHYYAHVPLILWHDWWAPMYLCHCMDGCSIFTTVLLTKSLLPVFQIFLFSFFFSLPLCKLDLQSKPPGLNISPCQRRKKDQNKAKSHQNDRRRRHPSLLQPGLSSPPNLRLSRHPRHLLVLSRPPS